MGDQETNTATNKKSKKNINKMHQKIDFINILNDDCLISILQYLPVKEKIRVARVSKRFNELSKLSWSNVKKCWLQKDYSIFNDETIPIIGTNQILNHCGIYLEKIRISCFIQPSTSGTSDFQCTFCMDTMKQLISTTGQIKSLKFYQHYSNTHNVIDNELKLLFLKNQTLKSLSLDISITGECFSTLQLNNVSQKISKLKLITSNNLKSEHIKEYFPLFKNLEKINFKLADFRDRIEILVEIITALSENCTKIEDLIIDSQSLISSNKQFEILFSNNKNIRELKLNGVDIDNAFLSSLRNCNVEYLKIVNCKVNAVDLLSNLPKLKKLKKLFFDTESDLDESFMKAFYFCENLRYLSLESSETVLKSFNNFCHLEELKLDLENITDSCLFDICKCVQLKSLMLAGEDNTFTDKGLIAIRTHLLKLNSLFFQSSLTTDKPLTEFIQLKKLTVLGCDNVQEEGLCTLIKKSRYLEFLDVSCNENVTQNLIDFVLDKKNLCHKNKVLFIALSGQFDVDEIQNESSLVKFAYDDRAYHDYYN